MYSTHLLWGVAQILLLDNWLAGWSLLVFVAPVVLYRIPVEERMMIEHFGDEYRSYTERTGRIVPRITRK